MTAPPSVQSRFEDRRQTVDLPVPVLAGVVVGVEPAVGKDIGERFDDGACVPRAKIPVCVLSIRQVLVEQTDGPTRC